MLLIVWKWFFSKLRINSLQVNAMENLRKRFGLRIVNIEKDYLKYTSKRSFISPVMPLFMKLNHEIKRFMFENQINLCWIYCSWISKWLKFWLNYNFIKKHSDAELLFTDTDSLTYEIKWVDVYEKKF